jgi:folate-binding protein YgfZ
MERNAMTEAREQNRADAGTLAGTEAANDEAGLAAAQNGAFLCALSAYAVFAIDGPDAESFLQGQLSNDVQGLAPGRCQIACYNTPKGRMLATLLLWRRREGFLAQLPASIADSVIKRLSMFVLRSKVKMTNVSDRCLRLGLGGPKAAAALRAHGLPVPDEDYGVSALAESGARGEGQVLRLPGNRYEIVLFDMDAGRALGSALRQDAIPAGELPWRWLGVRSGMADIEIETQDKYVPQMLNLELLGGISFTKGCYPGQEIVARTQYRGEIKRRMFLAHVDAAGAPRLGQDVVAGGGADAQTVGSIAAQARAPDGGYDVLACLHIDLAHNASLHLGDVQGPRLELRKLPYPLPQSI